jgi:ubiquitin-protein ligase
MEGKGDSFVKELYEKSPCTVIFITWLYYSTRYTYKEIENIYNEYTTEEEWSEHLGMDIFRMVRYYILKYKILFQITKQFQENRIYKVINPEYIEGPFRVNKITKGQSHYKYHGSNTSNWLSILTNGVKNYSNTEKMVNGNSYGNGIYLSNTFTLSNTYSSNGNKNNQKILGIYEVLGSNDKYKKTDSIWVIPNENELILRYIVVYNGGSTSSISNYIDYLTGNVTINENVNVNMETIAANSKRGVKRLYKEYLGISSSDKNEYGIRGELQDNNLYIWYVYLNNFPKETLLQQDLDRYGVKDIKLRIEFSEEYPYHPPFIHILYPEFETGTAHVTSDGAICMESLTRSGWSQLTSMENLLIQIKDVLVSGNGRIKVSSTFSRYFNNAIYDTNKAKESFNRVAKAHGWG